MTITTTVTPHPMLRLWLDHLPQGEYEQQLAQVFDVTVGCLLEIPNEPSEVERDKLTSAALLALKNQVRLLQLLAESRARRSVWLEP
jgi:hypothetical protein